MIFSFPRRTVLLTIATLAAIAALPGCRSNAVLAGGGSGSSAPMSGPPTFNDYFQARNPRVCRQVTTPPTPEEAAALVQCDWEGKSIMSGVSASLGLVTDVQVQMSKPRPFRMEFVNGAAVDTTAMVYDLRGQATSWTCGHANAATAGTSCQKSEGVPGAKGECFKTTFGDWRCNMFVGGGTYSTGLRGPMTY